MSSSALSLSKPIVLIGMMGAGKSAIGKMLAKSLNIPFYDSDHCVEERLGVSISEIFHHNGESYFRDKEFQVIDALLKKGACVISTGGGAPTVDKTRDTLLEKAVVVWLDTNADVIYERVKNCKTRPLLQGNKPRKKITELLDVRRPIYQQAHIHIENSKKAPKHTVSEIIQRLEEYR